MDGQLPPVDIPTLILIHSDRLGKDSDKTSERDFLHII